MPRRLCAALRELDDNGPSRSLSIRVRGRLALYRMIDEGPHGWTITAVGRQALHCAPILPLSPQQMLFSLPPVLATAQNMTWADTE